MDRGVVLREIGRFDLEEIEVDAPGEGEVLVRIEASGVCHSDLHVVETGWAHPLPVLLGHEGAGVVEGVGGGVTALAPGDRVVLGWRSPCGACRWCTRGDVRRCRTPPGVRGRLHLTDGSSLAQTLQMGTFATRTVVHSAAAIPIAEGLPPEQACLIGCSVATGIGSVLNTAGVWEGARVAVIGCGAVGLSVVQGARLAGASEIYALDLEERKLAAAESFGATHRGPGFEARLRLRRRRPAGDRRPGHRHARPCRHARVHRSTAARRSRGDRSPAALRPAPAGRRLASAETTSLHWTSHSWCSGPGRARSISPGWSRSGSDSGTWRRRSTTSRRARSSVP